MGKGGIRRCEEACGEGQDMTLLCRIMSASSTSKGAHLRRFFMVRTPHARERHRASEYPKRA